MAHSGMATTALRPACNFARTLGQSWPNAVTPAMPVTTTRFIPYRHSQR